jgi:hypothetical protein
VIKRDERIDEIPGILIAGMKNMSAVTMYIDPLSLGTINIASGMRATIDDQTTFTDIFQCMGKHTAVEP